MGDSGDIFDSLFGRFGGRGGKPKGPMKAKPKMKEVPVSLEDIFTGKVIKVSVKRKRPCESCEGKGGSNAKTCTTCKGNKRVAKLVMLGPGMYT